MESRWPMRTRRRAQALEEIPEAQDVFFKAKKAQFADRSKEEKANLALKMALLEKIEAFEFTDNRNADLDTLKGFSTEWREIGFIPSKNLDR